MSNNPRPVVWHMPNQELCIINTDFQEFQKSVQQKIYDAFHVELFDYTVYRLCSPWGRP